MENKIWINKAMFKLVNNDLDLDQKIERLLQWFESGADINYVDDDKNYTPLHIAVIRGETKIVELLLHRGASIYQRNVDGKTALDMALSLNIPNKLVIINLLEISHQRGNASTSAEESSESGIFDDKSISRNDKDSTVGRIRSMENMNCPFFYSKRSGTSGIGGQLYETKLLSLVLLRALNDKNITNFYLGTNVEGVGAFDDIVLKYEVEGEKNPKIDFIQAKHKDDPSQNKITIQDLFKEHGDFSLHKYFDSYLKIRNKFNSNTNDIIFKGIFKHVDCSFIIFTPAIENLGEQKSEIVGIPGKNTFDITTSKSGQVFKLNYCERDVENLLALALEIRTQLLGKTLMKFLFKENYKNLLTDDLMKAYHVFLAKHVVEVEVQKASCPYLSGRFQSSFFKSKDKYLVILKETIYKQFASKYSICAVDQIEYLAQSFSFKLPLNFGNINFIIGGGSKKIERRLKYISSKIKRILDAADSSNTNVINIDDSMIGPESILLEKDLEMHRLGGLVGNLFILDNNTFKLKFTDSPDSLPPLVTKIFDLLKKEFPDGKDFNKYRIDIKNYRFPKLLLCRHMDEVCLVESFLDSLRFYTNQACEDNVEHLLKDEIDNYCKFDSIKDGLLRRMKSETIFLKVHDKIQKWWKQPHKSVYLDPSCMYYDEAIEELFNNSLLCSLHILFIKQFSVHGIQFQQFDDQFDIILKNDRDFLTIVTDNILLTNVKLLQYMQCNSSPSSYIFVNLDFVMIQNCFNEVFLELKGIKLKTIFIVCENIHYYEKILNLVESLQGFLVIVTKFDLREKILPILKSRNYMEIFDERIEFMDLAMDTRKHLLNETQVLFQGYKILLKSLIKNKLDIIDSTSLCAILKKQNIIIGKECTKVNIEEFENCYIEHTVNRFITLQEKTDENILYIDVTKKFEVIPNECKEVIFISDKVDEFVSYCEKYKDKNFHWFIKDDENYVWKKSIGTLNVLSDFISKDSSRLYKFKPRTLLDIDEKVVIVCAEPGMGKSTLMTYLTIQTKIKYPGIWIIRINCLDYKNLFSYWQENKTNIDLKEVIMFLYVASQLLIVKENNVVGFDADIFQYNFKINIGPCGDVCLDTKDQKFVGLPYLEVGIFNYLYNNGSIAIVFDGFDEISPDYVNEVLKFLEILKDSKVCRIWITTRPYNILCNLEQKMGTFAFMLEKLSLEDQHELLQKLWGKAVGEKKNCRLSLYVQRFFDAISIILLDREKNFTSIPLHINMIAEIYVDFFKVYYDPYVPSLPAEFVENIKCLNSLILYERFVNTKFYKILFGEKKPYIYDRDPDMKKMIEMRRKEFIETHKKLSAHILFDKTIKKLFSKQEIKDIYDALDSVKKGEERTGIIDRVANDEPIFVHLSFAEYFAVEYLCDKLKAEECSLEVWIYLFDKIYTTDRSLLRIFFNQKLLADQDLFNLCENFKFDHEIFNKLINHNNFKSLQTALSEALERNALFLLRCIRNVLNENNLGQFLNCMLLKTKVSCSFCNMVSERLVTVLEFVLDHVKEIDRGRLIELFKCGDVPLFNALVIAISYCIFPEDVRILHILLSCFEDTDSLLELFTMPCNMGLLRNTILHVLVMNNYSFTMLIKYLNKFSKVQLMKIFSTSDADGKLAAHFAAQNGDQNFFLSLRTLLSFDQFKIICRTRDNIGLTPINYLKRSIGHDKGIDLVTPISDLLQE